MRKTDEAGNALNELLKLVPDFSTCGRQQIGRYVKVDSLIDRLVQGLGKAGLEER